MPKWNEISKIRLCGVILALILILVLLVAAVRGVAGQIAQAREHKQVVNTYSEALDLMADGLYGEAADLLEEIRYESVSGFRLSRLQALPGPRLYDSGDIEKAYKLVGKYSSSLKGDAGAFQEDLEKLQALAEEAYYAEKYNHTDNCAQCILSVQNGRPATVAERPFFRIGRSV